MEKARIRSYRDLDVWQSGVDLVTRVYEITRKLPKEEVFCLSSQMQRAAISIPSNIAEGHARTSCKEFLQFISISLGSLAELETQIHIANRLSYLDDAQTRITFELTESVGKMLRGLQRSLRVKSKGQGTEG